jgi:hypothetical protein
MADDTWGIHLIKLLMKRVLERLFSKKPKPLTGTPTVRRQKNYSAQSGYVYQYYYEGHRESHAVEGNADEFVFSISADRKNWTPASVVILDAALRAWSEQHGRELNSTERYAVAKMALFQAFDERESPRMLKDAVCVRAADLDAIVETLGL